jgi:ACT domain-containing protein
MALADTLNTNLGGIPGQVQQKTRAAAEASAGMEEAVATKKQELSAPIQAEKEKEVGAQQQVISDVGKKMAQPVQIPQETIADFSTLGGLVAIAGVMLGSSGKQSAQNVLNSMTGIMDGYKKGRADMVSNYQKEFDMNQKRMQSQIQQAQTELGVILEKYKTRDQTVAQDLAVFSAKYAKGIAATIADGQSADKVASLQVQLSQISNSQAQAAARIDAERETADKKNVIVNPTTGERGYMSSKTGKFVPLTMPEGFVSDQGGAEAPFMVTADGKPVYPDATGRYPTGQPLYKAGALGGGKSGASGAQAGSIERMNQAFTQAADAVKNVARLEVKTTLPMGQQKFFTSLFTAPLSALNQKMSDETSQLLQTRMSGVSRNLASLETGGAATGLVGLTQSLEAGIGIPKGAQLWVALDKLAEMRKIIDSAARAALASPLYTAEQKALVRENLEITHKAIPFTQEDIDEARRRGADKKLKPSERDMTFTEYANKINLGSRSTSPQIDPRAIERLKTDPDGLREAFDKKYGPGSANRVLGQQ